MGEILLFQSTIHIHIQNTQNKTKRFEQSVRAENDIRQQNAPVFYGSNYFYPMACTSLLLKSLKSFKYNKNSCSQRAASSTMQYTSISPSVKL